MSTASEMIRRIVVLGVALSAAAACQKSSATKTFEKVPGLPGGPASPGGKGDLVSSARDAAYGTPGATAIPTAPPEAGVPEVVLPGAVDELGDPAEAVFTVSAKDYYTSTGWFLRKDEHVKIKVTGGTETWSCDNEDHAGHGPRGIPAWGNWDGCIAGSFVAHVTTNVSDWIDTMVCVGDEVEIVAPHDGVLQLGPNDSGTEDNEGALTVNVRRIVPLPATPPAAVPLELQYGSRRVTVPANRRWVSTGLFLRPGDTVGVHTRGETATQPGEPKTGPEGLSWFNEGCPAATLRGVVANYGNGKWNEQKLCLGRDMTFVAEHEGVLFLGVNDNWPSDNTGEFAVTLSSAARYIPTVGSDYDFGFDPRLESQSATAYGRRVVNVPAASTWTNSALYLKAGQKAHIEARGEWNMGWGPAGPEGIVGDNIYQGCLFGSLRAVIGLELEEDWDQRMICVGSALELTATRDGVLFLAVTDDMTYVYDNGGSMNVVVTSDADAAPVLPAARIASFDYAAIGAGTVELAGKHVLFTLPAATVARVGGDAAARMVAEADKWFETITTLQGKGAEKTDHIRVYPDPGLAGTARAVVPGNPLRIDPALLAADGLDGLKIVGLADGGDAKHDFLRALAVSIGMSFQGGRYAAGPGVIRAWGDLLTKYAIGALNLPGEALADPCASDDTKDFLEKGTFDQLAYAREPVFCMLSELQAAHGWPFFTKFYEDFHGLPDDQVPYRWDDAEKRWNFVRESMSRAAGMDVTPELVKFKVQFP